MHRSRQAVNVRRAGVTSHLRSPRRMPWAASFPLADHREGFSRGSDAQQQTPSLVWAPGKSFAARLSRTERPAVMPQVGTVDLASWPRRKSPPSLGSNETHPFSGDMDSTLIALSSVPRFMSRAVPLCFEKVPFWLAEDTLSCHLHQCLLLAELTLPAA
uniref:Uncharacterized protein n=1 Tax=Sphaerodactylus townsendi TaxID=933632 RepID=A0ACB8G7C3_9SAUR